MWWGRAFGLGMLSMSPGEIVRPVPVRTVGGVREGGVLIGAPGLRRGLEGLRWREVSRVSRRWRGFGGSSGWISGRVGRGRRPWGSLVLR